MEMSGIPTAPMAVQPSPNTNSNNSNDGYAANVFPLSHHPMSPPMIHSVESPPSDSDLSLKESKVQNLKFLNALSFLLTALVVVGMVLFRAREEGVFGDEYLWMKYQTLLTPPQYVNLIWIPVFLLQGLFVYASTLHPTLRDSPLVGYDRPSSSSVAVHYPAVCATTLAAMYSHDYGRVGWAFVWSVLCGVTLTNVLRIQGEAMNDVERAEAEASAMSMSTTSSVVGNGVRSQALRYAALRLPFELYGGYVLALVGMYFNCFLGGFEGLSTTVFLAAANVTLALLLCAGWVALWKTERKSYGVGASLVWYLLGVAIELHAPTQPIYNEFSDGAILATQVVAGLATLVLATLLGVRVMKTVIKHNVLGWGDALEVGTDTSVVSERMMDGEIGAGYVRA